MYYHRDCGPGKVQVHQGGVKCSSRCRLQQGFKLWFPQTQGGGVKKIEPKRVDSILYTMIEFFNHGIQGTATWSQLSFVPSTDEEADIIITQQAIHLAKEFQNHEFVWCLLVTKQHIKR